MARLASVFDVGDRFGGLRGGLQGMLPQWVTWCLPFMLYVDRETAQ